MIYYTTEEKYINSSSYFETLCTKNKYCSFNCIHEEAVGNISDKI